MVAYVTFGEITAMVWLAIYRLLSALVDLISVRRLAEHEKDLELVLLRQHLDILQRTRRRPPRIAGSDKLVRCPQHET